MQEQDLPRAGHVSVTDELIELLRMRERKGIATYGRSLQTFNGRDANRDLVEELIDATQYALQGRLEKTQIEEQLAVAQARIVMLTRIVQWMAKRCTASPGDIMI